MSRLSVYHHANPELPNKVLTHAEDIAVTLAEVGVHFERWPATALALDAGPQQMIAAYRVQIDRLGYASVEPFSVERDHPQRDELRAALPVEQRGDADEAYFFVAGRGLFNLHIGDHVYAVLCEKHDLLTVPAGTCHWFDMGEFPHFVALRLGHAAPGATQPTGDAIASRFPRLED